MVSSQKAHPILLTLLKIQRKHHKDYSFPSQLHILALLGRYQQIRKSRSTLNRWLRVIEDSKFIIRRRRIRRDPVFGTVFSSTLYKISIKGYKMLSRFGVDVLEELALYYKWREEIAPRKEKLSTVPVGREGLNKLGFKALVGEFLAPV